MLLGILSILGIWSSYMVISGRNEVSCVLYLVMVYVNMSGILLQLGVEYMGLLLLIIYVGAVAILFLFVVMMLVGRDRGMEEGGKWGNWLLEMGVIWSVVLGLLWMMGGMEVVVVGEDVWWVSVMDNVRDISEMGEILFSENILEVLVGGLILLVAMMGGIKLTSKKVGG